MKKPFEDKYTEEPMSGCFLWIEALTSDGYGRVLRNGKNCRAHRVSWEMENGKIPDGLTIDHLCRTRSCVNTRHMEVVTRKENTLRGYGPSAMLARQKHCPKCGGAYEIRSSTRGKYRVCRKCKNKYDQLLYAITGTI